MIKDQYSHNKRTRINSVVKKKGQFCVSSDRQNDGFSGAGATASLKLLRAVSSQWDTFQWN